MRSDYLVLALLWAAYCTIHSALISIRVVNFFRRVLGSSYSFYRLFFNAFSLVTLAPLIIYSGSPRYQDRMLLVWRGNWRILRYSLIALAAVLIISGARHYSLSQFLGIRQIRSKSSRGAMTETGNIDTAGVLGITRHPWYVAVFFLLWADNLDAAKIVINVVLSVYLVIGTLLEERKLVLEFGEKYREYQQRVSMFIPVKWLKSRLKVFPAVNE
jgi:methanethiol S-methyltransferase